MPFSRFSDYFIAVAETGSLRKAAEQQFISVSAVHRQISLAEQEMGVELFERYTQGLKLTLAGEMLYNDLKKWRKDYQYTRLRFDEIQGLSRGTVYLGAISALSEGLMLDSIAKFQADYPWIHLNLQIAETEKIIQQIINSELDFGLVINPKAQSMLQVVDYVDLPIGFVMHPEHDLAQHHMLSFYESLDTTHILASTPLMIHDCLHDLYKQHTQPKQQIQSNDIRLIRSLVEKNLGISLLSYLDVYEPVQKKQLVFVPLKDKNIQKFRLALCVAPKRQLSKAASCMMKMTSEWLDDLKQHIQLQLSPNH